MSIKHISHIGKIGIIVGVFIFIFLYVKTYRYMTAKTGITPLSFASVLFGNGIPLKETDGKTSIALFGIGGGTHEGALLTDTILIITITQKTKELHLLSLPRDMWSETLRDKVNSAYYYGEEKKQGGGMILAKSIVEEITGVPIHYGVVVDFSQFTSIIDTVGGIDVMVDQPFIDTEYPIAGRENDLCDGDPEFLCRYTTITFPKGMTHMDGATALMYARSRHAEGDEGTDFARAKRQQDMIVALKNKVMARKPWLDPKLAASLFALADSATTTDMSIGEQITIAKYGMTVNENEMKRISLTDQVIVGPSWMYTQYVLIPNESWDALHEYIKGEMEK